MIVLSMKGKLGWLIKEISFLPLFLQECIDRVLKRGQSSGRTDDNMESLKKR